MRVSLAGLLFVSLVACGAPVASDELTSPITLQTDRAAYSASLIGGEGTYRTYTVTVVAQFTNRTALPVYLERCYPDTPYPIYGIVSAEEGREAAYNPVWACVGHDRPIVVSGGKTRTDSLHLSGPNAWDGRTNQPFGDLVGRFRLSYAVGTCRAVSRCEVPGQVGESNEFEVRLEP
jgi:hypothetical protein